MKKQTFLITFLVLTTTLFAQTNLSTQEKHLNQMSQAKQVTIPLFNGSYEYFTMKQTDDLFMSLYGIGTDLFYESYLNNTVTKENFFPVLLTEIGFILFDSSVISPISHEEAHRSVLTVNGIGSVSQPIFKSNKSGNSIAYVKGVEDSTLEDFRDTNFPSFIRMHTAGLESDYSIVQREYAKLAFDCADKEETGVLNPFLIDYFLRDIHVMSYMMSANGKGLQIDEEENELARDIVGDDVSGMIHHLYNPTAEYHRYFSPADFSKEEKKFAQRIFAKSFLNVPVISPLIFGKYAFGLGENVNLSFNTGYALAPFGDFMDENVYIRVKDVMNGPLDMIFTARQYQNKDTWFPAFELKCQQFSPLSWLTLNASASLWWQPEDLSFTTDKSFVGGSFEFGCNVYPFEKAENAKYDFGFNLNCMYKTKGFQTEVMSLDKGFCVTAGLCIKY